jgi:tRNA uridine 5-carbamoylmethylation protein Kti12
MTLIIGLLAGPGVGKSTMAGGIFNRLKTDGYNVEYVQEFAKTLTWEKNWLALSNQFYVSAVQKYTQDMLLGQVEAIITDSPIIIGLMYYKETNPVIKKAFETFIIESFKAQNNINFFLNRTKDYNPIGRNQTLAEAIEIDNKIKQFLTDLDIPFYTVNGDNSGLEEAYKEIIKCI